MLHKPNEDVNEHFLKLERRYSHRDVALSLAYPRQRYARPKKIHYNCFSILAAMT